MAFAPMTTYGSTPPGEASRPADSAVPPRRFGDAVRIAGVVGLLVFCSSYLFTQQTWSPISHLEGVASTVSSATTTTLSKSDVQGLNSVEQAFVDGVQPEKLREFLHAYASVPHTCGTKQDYETALYTAQQWESYGIQAEVVEYYTLLSYPVHRRLAIVSPEQNVQELNLTEGSVVDDSCTTDPTALPPFLAYSATGNVTASVVYANFGTQQDFEWLANNNVTLEGKIALVRYGANMRGMKVMAAEKYDIAGVLIYSDPNEDGFTRGPVYPEGFYRPEDSFQRGSVNYIPLYSGDPMTPGWASVAGASRLTYEEVTNIPRIPVLPLSYGQARRILAALGGQKVIDSWQGGLPLEYKLGDDGAVVLNLDVVMDNHVGPIWDVIGTIKGSEEPEKQVVLGNHRDAWVCGAVDPSSGSATLMEIARGLGSLLEVGWRPRRTIVLGSWDGEEYALLGSTEWVEDNAKELRANAVAYLNVDLLVGPLVSASAAPSIAKFVQDTASVLPANPFDGKKTDGNFSLLDQWAAQLAEFRSATGGLPAPGDRTLAPDHLINFMGSGSDFTPFYQHLGVISVNLAFGLTYASYGTYHSTMDSLHYMETQGDPHYASHASMAKWWGVLAMRLASDAVIPFDFSSYSLVMNEGLEQLEERLADASLNVELSKLYAAIKQFGINADVFQTTAHKLLSSTNSSALSAWNNKAIQLERKLLSLDGLPHRPWYKHVIFGPGFYEGYAGAAFPGITDCLAFYDDADTIQIHVDEVTRVVTSLYGKVASKTELNSIEQQLVDGIDPAHIREYLHKYSSKPHIAGSQADYETALYTVDQFESFGIKTEIKEYYTLLSTPVRRCLAILEPAEAAQELNLTEASVTGDACTADPTAEPPFLAYSPSGNVTAPVVYVNYGTQQDFQWAVDQGIELKGKIALVRYGENYRGLKVLAALEHGMAGVLIYSDPLDDGFGKGPVYPEGPWRPENSFQRGSIYNECGDPLTPGWASLLGAKYLKYEDVTTIPHLPTLPLSYGQAKYILKALRGKQAPASWQGGLTFPDGGYHIGDDSSTVLNLDLEMDNSIGPIWDVIGTIEGSEEPDKQVILGNHRDAWVCGAIDPNSGTSVLVELGRVFGNMLKQGWKPKRTIVLASWDAEEQGLLGSTEYVEDNAELLKEQAIAYLNVDGTLGPLADAGGSPSIAKLLFQTANAIPANAFGGKAVEEKTLYEQWLSQTEAYRQRNATSGTIGPDHLISVLGTGSDFGGFCHHLGIVSANVGFTFPGNYGTYHSTMDSIMYSELFADPDYVSHVTTARWWGLLALRLADNDVLPLEFSTYALVMDEAVTSFEEALKVAAERYPGVDEVNFAELRRAIDAFDANTKTFHTRLSTVGPDTSSAELSYWNDKLMYLERHLTLDAGLPHRGWYKHVVFGPGFYDGYGGTAFPGLADGIAFHDSADAIQAHVDDVVGVLDGAAAFLLAE
ncbi:hypothetical protein BBI17_002654 [Phytophthora kernoviae]|uniref:Glutamate carboxypeptidase n=1 Tax=Phytophthora kernoviae TaxID=325452 RepID=A0A3R7ILX2_9STRA|nr:hypothetical protein BBI17_002654 [Phytophthora kernoviae]